MASKISGSKIAKTYADALFQLGVSLYIKEKNAEVFYKLVFDLQDLLKLLSETPIFKEYLDSPVIPKSQKKEVLVNSLGKKVLPNTLNFLLLLIDAKRINQLEQIAVYYLEQVYDYLGIKFVDVYSATELTEKQQTVLSAKLESMFGPVFTKPYVQPAKVVLKMHTDSSLLGGFVIKSGSKIVDLSLKGELQDLAKNLGVKI